MNRSERHKLNRLLSSGSELSVQEKEEMLRTLFSQDTGGIKVKDFGARSVSTRLLGIGSAAVAAAAGLLVVFVLMFEKGPSKVGENEFTAKGGASEGGFRVECIVDGGQSGACKQGNSIVFGVLPPKGAVYFSAAAVDDDGRMIRYFPSETRTSLKIDSPGVFNKGVRIDETHRAGTYRVFGIFSASPLSVEEMRLAVDAFADGKPIGIRSVLLVREVAVEVVEP